MTALAPGSDAARHQGCTCSILDNARGAGWLGMPGRFVMSADCTMHGVKAMDARFKEQGRAKRRMAWRSA